MNFKYLIIFIFLISSSYLKINASGAESSIFGYVPSTGPGTLLEWFSAAKKDRVNELRELIKVCDVNAQDYSYNGFTALMWAANQGKRCAVDFLLNVPNIDINKQDSSGRTALMLAISQNREDIVEKLLRTSGINVNLRSNDGYSALLLAFHYQRENIIKLLFQIANIDVNAATNQDGITSLMYAAADGDENIVNLLLDSPGIKICLKNKQGEDALYCAKKQDQEKVFNLIKNRIEELTVKLFEAIEANNLETVKSIISKIGDTVTDKDANTILDKAFSANRPEIIFYLLQNAEDPRELLVRFPFEKIAPSSPIFEYFFKLAYDEIPIPIKAETAKKVDTKSRHCHVCSTETTSKCAGCKKIYYCSQKCQKADWKEHKKVCGKTH